MESLEAVRLTKPERHTQHWNEVALSSGGQGTGKFWTHIPNGMGEFLGADHFITALRLRLADLDFDPLATCQMPVRRRVAEGAKRAWTQKVSTR